MPILTKRSSRKLTKDPELAALAYDAAAIQIYGYDAKLNILEQS